MHDGLGAFILMVLFAFYCIPIVHRDATVNNRQMLAIYHPITLFFVCAWNTPSGGPSANWFGPVRTLRSPW